MDKSKIRASQGNIYQNSCFSKKRASQASAVLSGDAGGATEIWGSQKGRSLISAYQSLAITTNTPGFEKLNTALQATIYLKTCISRFFGPYSKTCIVEVCAF